MAQAAESFVCQLVGETSLTALETAVPVENGGEQQVRVSHRDGKLDGGRAARTGYRTDAGVLRQTCGTGPRVAATHDLTSRGSS